VFTKVSEMERQAKVNCIADTSHERFQNSSANELKNIMKTNDRIIQR